MATEKKLVRLNSLTTSDGFLRCGYPVHNIGTYEKRWICLWCSNMIKEPIQLTECGHRMCRGCFESRAATMDAQETRPCPDPMCDKPFQKDQFMMDRAFKREIDVLIVACLHKTGQACSWVGPLKKYQEHLDEKHAHHPCELCEEIFPSSIALAEHKESKCPKLFIKCLLAPYCTNEMLRRDDYPEHLLSEKHQETVTLILAGKIIPNESSAVAADNEMEISTADQQLETQLGEKFNSLGEKIQKFNDESVDLSRDFIRLSEQSQVIATDLNQMEVLINERNKILNNFQDEQQQIQKKLIEFREKIEENGCVSTDGVCLWRIDNVVQRMADAQSERQTSIFSPPFYSAINGYKMRARLYLHGDGSARRTHISLFFMLMKSEHDALLRWPFHYKVTFCLIDQTGQGRHMIDSFRPDVKSNSFQRPTSNSNIASGIPKFFPLPMLQQEDSAYVRDDTMFIKIMVDLTEMPKPLLPFACGLNPGFPYHVQQHLINEEKNRQQQQQDASVATTSVNTSCA